MKQINKIFALLILFAFVACGADHANMEESQNMQMAATSTANATDVINQRKLIREADLEFETEELGATKSHLKHFVNAFKGYIADENEYRSSGRITANLTVRVPSAHFDSLLYVIDEFVPRFNLRSISSMDVTEEFLDVEARLKAKKAVEKRLIALLQRAGTMKDILEIEKQIGELRSEIESIEGRMNYLENRTQFSTLNITCYQSVPEDQQFGREFSKGFEQGWENLVWFFIGLTNIWPFVLLTIAVILMVKRLRQIKRNK